MTNTRSDQYEQEDGEAEVLSGELQVGTGAEMFSAVERASIDMQIATAHQYPRSLQKSQDEAMAMATLDQDVATSMFFAMPRSGKLIAGPSIRLAEVWASAWGNLRVAAEIIADDGVFITAMGTCFDLEKNVAIRIPVRRRITNKQGIRFSDDMIVVTGNAAASIALRNAIFRVVPRALVDQTWGAARKASLGEGGTMEEKRQKAADWFGNLGVTELEIFAVLKVKGWKDIMEDELVTLRGFMTSIKDGNADVERIFRPEPEKTSDASAELRDAAGEGDDGAEGAPEDATGGPDSEDEAKGTQGDAETQDGSEEPQEAEKKKTTRKRKPKGKKPAPEEPEAAADHPPAAETSPEETPPHTADATTPEAGTQTTNGEGDAEPAGEADEQPEGGGDLIAEIVALEEQVPDLAGPTHKGTLARRRRRFTGDELNAPLETASEEGLQAYKTHLEDCLA